MQSQYGFSENQQFMVDGGYSPLFSISTADIHGCSQPQRYHQHAHQLQQQEQQQQHRHHHHQQVQRQHHQQQQLHLHHHHPQLQVQQLVPPPQPFQHFHAIPITQQLFQQTHQFHLFQQEQQRRMHQQQPHLGLDQDPGPVISGSPSPVIAASCGGAGGDGGGVPPFYGLANFKLAINESAGGGSRDGLKDEEDVPQGDEVSESRIPAWTAEEEESAVKEPFWRPLDVNYINRNNERCNEKQMEFSNTGKHLKLSREGINVEDGNNGIDNYKLFSELEAIYKPGSSGGDGGGGGIGFGGGNSNQQTGSISTLTAENPPTVAAELGPDGVPNIDTADQGSNSSTAEEAVPATRSNKSSGSSRKRKRKQQLSSIATFLESLVKKLMEHQEDLHRKFLEVLERRDQERTNREEMWRQQEAAKAGREAMARAQEQALASTREAAIISFLEKVTGESLNLPTRAQFQSLQLLEETSQKEGTKHVEDANAYTATTTGGGGNTEGNTATSANQGLANASRWPKAEVQTLIRVRSSLEWRFQEPGLKGPLWEEVSSAMASRGYHRSAKRCKEKWENINKYFRKSKDSAKKRPQHSKTCPYFQQLDQLYSKSLCATPPASAVAASATTISEREGASELREAIVVDSSEERAPIIGFNEIGTTRLTFPNREDNENTEPSGGATTAGQAPPGLQWQRVRNVENDDDDEEDEEEGGKAEEEEEGEGESQEHASKV